MRGQTAGGRYRLESVLGRGGTATVWLAGDRLLGRWVALKRGNGETLNEARAAARLSHPGVVRVLDLEPSTDLFSLGPPCTRRSRAVHRSTGVTCSPPCWP